MTRRRGWSDITVTDQFCGAGGSSIGAAAQGLRIRMAMNHWELAVETHNTNFPETDHDCCDVSATDPRRYPSTDILITSPECTTHSPAGGNKHRKSPQRDLFIPTELDPETQRSRATMWDVVRFAEYHEYEAIIVENVVEVVRNWVLFWTWWKAMENLGYYGQMVSLNSMFCWPTPQSRDRIYVAWTRGRRWAPDLETSPLAPCAKCGDVEARQTWRQGRRVGKYGLRRQYWYTCPICRVVVTPYYYCALNAIDFSIPATRIGDRDEPLKPRTLARVKYGLETYGRRPLQVTTNNKSGMACRVRGVDDPLFAQTTSLTTALVSPWLVNAGSNAFTTRSAAESVAPTMTGSERLGVAGIDPSFTPFMVVNRTHNNGNALDGPAPAVVTGTPHIVVQPSAIVRLIGDRPVFPLDKPNATQTTGADQNMIVSPSPFLVQYYGRGRSSSAVDAPVPVQTTLPRHALVEPGIDVNDCFFRMFVVAEVKTTMAFPGSYVIKGTKGKQIKQLGNAVTPPAMAHLIERVAQYLTGVRRIRVRAA